MTTQASAPAAAAAAAGFDRSALERAAPGLRERLREDASTRVLLVRGDAVELTDGTALRWRSAAEVPDDALWAFLGRDTHERALLMARVDADGLADGAWGSLRTVGGVLSADEADVLTTATSLARWLADSAYCPRCGAATEVENAGWSRRCVGCGAEHFPRTDPAVIVAVTSASAPARLLLGSNALWGANRFSCFAGFVEAGESAEAAVERELFEEAGVRVRDVQYQRSQSWPYPRSLMLGFRARAVADDEVRPDGDEIAAVRWFSRAEIGEALERGDWVAGGDGLLLPGSASIARRLIADWYAETA